MEAIDLPIVAELPFFGKVLNFLEDLLELVSVRLGVTFAARESERFQLLEGGVEYAGAPGFVLLQGVPGIAGVGLGVDLCAGILFATRLEHGADLVMGTYLRGSVGCGDVAAHDRKDIVDRNVVPHVQQFEQVLEFLPPCQIVGGAFELIDLVDLAQGDRELGFVRHLCE